MNIDVSHKVMRLDTVLDILTQLYSEVGENRFHNIATKKLVGETVLTRCEIISLSFYKFYIMRCNSFFYIMLLLSPFSSGLAPDFVIRICLLCCRAKIYS